VPPKTPRNGKVSAPVKPAAVKSPNSLPKPKPATAPVAASSSRQTKPTSSVRALPRASNPTAKAKSSVKPVVTKAAAVKPRVVPQPPKKQPATIAPRTTRSVPAPAKSTLPHRPSVQEQPAQTKTRLQLPKAKLPLVEEDARRSSRKIENRSSAAPKAKTVRFAGIDEPRTRCIPARLGDPDVYEEYGESTVFWEPSKEQLLSFQLSKAKLRAASLFQEARALADRAEARAVGALIEVLLEPF